MTEEENDTGEFVRALARGLALIEVFEGGDALTLAEAAKRTSLSRGTARRLLLTLVQLRYMSTDGHRYFLRPRLLALGHAYLSTLSLPDILRPHMEAMIGEERHVSSSAAVLDDNVAVYIAGVPAKGILRVTMSVGLRLPAAFSSMGRVLLAELSDAELDARLKSIEKQHQINAKEARMQILKVRELGFATADREVDSAFRSVAVPLRDRSGNCITAISLTSHDDMRPIEELIERFVPILQSTATRITKEVSTEVASQMLNQC